MFGFSCDECAGYKEDIKAYQKQRDRMSSDIKEWQDSYNTLCVEKRELRESTEKKDRIIVDTIKKIEQLECDLLEKSRKCNSLTEDNHRLIDNIDQKYKENQQIEDDCDCEHDDDYEYSCHNIIEDLRNDISDCKKLLDEDRKIIINLERDKTRSKQEIAAKNEYIQKNFHVGYEVKIRDLEKIADDLQAQLNCANGLTEYHSNKEKELKKELEKANEYNKYYLNMQLNTLKDTIQWKPCKGAKRPLTSTVVSDGGLRMILIKGADKIEELSIPMDEHKYYIVLPPLPKD